MEKLIINGVDIANGKVVKALNAMLDGADDATLRDLDCCKWDSQFYHIVCEATPFDLMVRKEFNCLTVWYTTAPTSFNDGDETVQKMYHPMCLISRGRDWEHTDVCRDLVNGFIRLGLLNAKEYIGPNEE